MTRNELIPAKQAEAESPLRRYTAARVSLGRAGSAIATAEQLRFQLDHSLARDAVHNSVNFASLQAGLRKRNFEALMLESAVCRPGPGIATRTAYLRRPDLGRRLSAASEETFQSIDTNQAEGSEADVVFVVADGLSALAVDRHALPLLDALTPLLPPDVWCVGPVCVVRDGRVAIGDEIGSRLRTKLVVVFIGERPGLSAPDSLGVYLTWDPRLGRTDAERNCVSNIRLGGLEYDEAARRIFFYMNAARELGSTGFALKEPAPQTRLQYKLPNEPER